MPSQRAVVVGAGKIANTWLAALGREKVDIAGVVDLNLQTAADKVGEHGLDCEIGTDLKAMLGKTSPDFVVDLTPPEAHCRITCAALQAGCHVIGEKPMASSMSEARRMVNASQKAGRLYMVSQSRRWDASHDAIRKALVGGAIGRITTVNCDFYMGCHFGGFRERMESPLILDMAIHHFDLARFFTGADPLAVYAHEFNPTGSWYRGDAAASCIFEMTDGIVFTYRGSWCAHGQGTSWNGNWRIVSDAGTLLFENDRPASASVAAGPEKFICDTEKVELPSETLKHTGQHGALRELLAYIRNDRKPQCDCHDNIKSLSMVFGAMSSSRRGRRVNLSGGK